MLAKLIIINALTLIRIIGCIILVPIYNAYGGFTVGIFSLICYGTDSIDGVLARHYKASTFFGAIFDGIADKLFSLVNFIVLYLITPYALIPIIFEVLTVLVQVFKFNNNYNVQSNIIGKSKVWILAICTFITFIASDVNKLTFLSGSLRSFISSIPYLYLLLPAIIIEVLTFGSYVFEIFKPSKKVVLKDNKKEIIIPEFNNKWDRFKKIWLNPEFYHEYKNATNLLDIWKLTK